MFLLLESTVMSGSTNATEKLSKLPVTLEIKKISSSLWTLQYPKRSI